MDQTTVASAVEALEEVHKALTAAYWDANDVFQKHTVFDILSIITVELSELSKLSIEDHYMNYEPVSSQFPTCARKFQQLQNNIDAWFPRTRTAQDLHESLPRALALIPSK